MDSIIIGFSRPKAFFEPFSWLIRLCTWCPYSHAYIKYYNSYADRWEVYQASGLKVNFIGYTMFAAAEDIYAEFTIPVSSATKQAVIQNAIDTCGLPYGIGQVIGFSWVLFMRAFGKKVKNPFYSGSSDFCSELAEKVIIEIGVGDLDPSTMDPKDVYNFLASKGFPVSQR